VTQISLSIDIDRPREEVFAYLADIANLAEFHDYYLADWHLTRADSHGLGAGVRFRAKAPLNRFAWADIGYAEVAEPERIVGRGAGGKFNRVPISASYELSERDGGTRVEYRLRTEPKLPSDRIWELAIGHGWLKRKSRRSLHRLKGIVEHERNRGTRPTIAGLR
jgi:uncharacterized protein YndB with AHSA1/START domain